jgi:two-component system CheB/CheR fusion protein
VLRTLCTVEKQIEATTGHWFSVRIMPYRTLADVIDGVVITLADITSTKKLEKELREEILRNKQANKG